MSEPTLHTVTCTVNGHPTRQRLPANRTLADFLRGDLGLTGTNIGCNTGDCGACTVLVAGRPVNSCLLLAVEADGATVTTIEGLADGAHLHPVQQGFLAAHGAQCGFCTPGMIMAAVGVLRDDPAPSEAAIRAGLEGNLCRCTGYTKIVEAVQRASGQHHA
jgi:aerobic carbon-monoxide dehydrogenase small subunit